MLKNSLVGAIELLVGCNSSMVFKVYMTDPVVALTAGAIASLAFQAFIKAGAGELAKGFTAVAIAKMKELHGLIQQRLQGNPDAVAAMEQAKNE